MTLQEVVDRNWQFFIRERGRPGVQGDECVFRARDGGRCAIGCVLPKGVRANGLALANLLETNAKVAALFTEVPITALEELMDLHDEIAHLPYFRVHYRAALREFAANWKLTIPDSYLLDDPKQLLLFDDGVPELPQQTRIVEMKPIVGRVTTVR